VEVSVIDPFGAAADPAIPRVNEALDPVVVQRGFARGLPRLAGEDGTVQVRSIRVTRHKPNRRCVIEYSLWVERTDAPAEAVTLLGKMRAGHSGKTGYRILDALWEAGFAADSPDGISVPEPIAYLAELGVWLQRKVPGREATELIAGPGGVALVQRIAEAACKLHKARVPGKRAHSMADEIRILHERLPAVAQVEPDPRRARALKERIGRLLEACDRLAAATPPPVPHWVHRDFYPDQVIVDSAAGEGDARLYLIDFDNYCEGDPGLDIGNFLGHITEQSLRILGDPAALADREQAMEEHFVALAGEATRPAVRAYAVLTLARHVYLSTLFPARRALTGCLLELCEERLRLAVGAHA
jgi:Phosphotransferase enzyme family